MKYLKQADIREYLKQINTEEYSQSKALELLNAKIHERLQEQNKVRITRSTYQKVVEWNKQLLIDIKRLCEDNETGEDFIEVVELKRKWRNKFQSDKSFEDKIKQYCKMLQNKTQ